MGCAILAAVLFVFSFMVGDGRAAITISKLEKNPATTFSPQVFAFTETAAGTPMVSTDSYRVRVSQTAPKAKWSVRISIVASFNNAASGVTLPDGDFDAENANLLGTYGSLAAPYTVQSGLSTSTTSSGYFHFRFSPPTGTESGTYAGTIRVTVIAGASSASTDITATSAVTANVAIASISDTGGTPVSNITFAETPPGSTSSAVGPYHVALTGTSGHWTVTASVTTSFTDAASGATLPDSAILVQGPLQGSPVPLSSPLLLESGIAATQLDSGGFTLQLAPDAAQDSGTFVGAITLTVSTV